MKKTLSVKAYWQVAVPDGNPVGGLPLYETHAAAERAARSLAVELDCPFAFVSPAYEFPRRRLYFMPSPSLSRLAAFRLRLSFFIDDSFELCQTINRILR